MAATVLDWPKMQKVLIDLGDVMSEPVDLPPSREMDHYILLLLGT